MLRHPFGDETYKLRDVGSSLRRRLTSIAKRGHGGYVSVVFASSASYRGIR